MKTFFFSFSFFFFFFLVPIKLAHGLSVFPSIFLDIYIYIFIAVALDESIFLDVLHFPMKNIMSRDLEATPMGEATSKSIQ